MSSNDLLRCEKCGSTFSRKQELDNHLSTQPKICKKIEAFILEKLTNVSKEHTNSINIIQENNKKVVDTLIHAPIGVKTRQKVIQNIETIEKNKVFNFEKVVYRTEIPISVLRNTVELLADGDVILFKRIFIEHVEPQNRCIRVKDFGRDKYEYFDGSVWVTTTLTYIIEQFANELHKKYKFMIFEKSDHIAEIDRMYPVEDYPDQNIAEIDEITVRYAKITEHVTKLGILDTDFINEIKRGVRGLLANPLPKNENEKEKKICIESNSEKFAYNPEKEDLESESEEISFDDDSYLTSDSNDNLLPIFKILGIKCDL
jgi:hypothetical protein